MSIIVITAPERPRSGDFRPKRELEGQFVQEFETGDLLQCVQIMSSVFRWIDIETGNRVSDSDTWAPDGFIVNVTVTCKRGEA